MGVGELTFGEDSTGGVFPGVGGGGESTNFCGGESLPSLSVGETLIYICKYNLQWASFFLSENLIMYPFRKM